MIKAQEEQKRISEVLFLLVLMTVFFTVVFGQQKLNDLIASQNKALQGLTQAATIDKQLLAQQINDMKSTMARLDDDHKKQHDLIVDQYTKKLEEEEKKVKDTNAKLKEVIWKKISFKLFWANLFFLQDQRILNEANQKIQDAAAFKERLETVFLVYLWLTFGKAKLKLFFQGTACVLQFHFDFAQASKPFKAKGKHSAFGFEVVASYDGSYCQFSIQDARWPGLHYVAKIRHLFFFWDFCAAQTESIHLGWVLACVDRLNRPVTVFDARQVSKVVQLGEPQRIFVDTAVCCCFLKQWEQVRLFENQGLSEFNANLTLYHGSINAADARALIAADKTGWDKCDALFAKVWFFFWIKCRNMFVCFFAAESH